MDSNRNLTRKSRRKEHQLLLSGLDGIHIAAEWLRRYNTLQPTPPSPKGPIRETAFEQRGNSLKYLYDFLLKAMARHWP
jgi:hypothetical protein